MELIISMDETLKSNPRPDVYFPSVPSAPLNLQASVCDGSVSLSWNPPSDDGGSSITQYRIYRGTSSGSETYYKTVSATERTFIDEYASEGRTYYYRVSAVNSAGEGPKSEEVSITASKDPLAEYLAAACCLLPVLIILAIIVFIARRKPSVKRDSYGPEETPYRIR